MKIAVLVSLGLAVTACETTKSDKDQPLAGSWGNSTTTLALTADGGKVTHECATGQIDGPVLPNSIGEFHVRGSFRLDTTERPETALYYGSIAGSKMTLRIVVPTTGRVVGPEDLETVPSGVSLSAGSCAEP